MTEDFDDLMDEDAVVLPGSSRREVDLSWKEALYTSDAVGVCLLAVDPLMYASCLSLLWLTGMHMVCLTCALIPDPTANVLCSQLGAQALLLSLFCELVGLWEAVDPDTLSCGCRKSERMATATGQHLMTLPQSERLS